MIDEGGGGGGIPHGNGTGRPIGLALEDLAWIGQVGHQLVLRRNALFCRAGQPNCQCGLLVEGVLQVYAVSPRGRRIVLDLIFPGMVALPPGASGTGMPALASIQAVTACTLRVWPGWATRTAPRGQPSSRDLWLRVAESALFHEHRRYLAARTLSAEERYARMAADLPEAWRRLPQHLIASYLGITPQYLSRIKRAGNCSRRWKTKPVPTVLPERK